MRAATLIVCLATACNDTADVPVTISHADVVATCLSTTCGDGPYYSVDSCGPQMGLIEAGTHQATIMSVVDEEDLAGVAQVQYVVDGVPGEPIHAEQALASGEKLDVYPFYEAAPFDVLYRIDEDGGVSDINTAILTAGSANELTFEYDVATYDDTRFHATETHVIDAPRPIAIHTDSPGITDACCSAGTPGGFLVALAFVGLRRRRR